MGKIQRLFSQLAVEDKKALIGYLTFGYPSIKKTEAALYQLSQHGADLIELGIPFSDPVADGPTIQYASQIALQNGVNLKKAFDFVGRIRKRVSVPIVLMSYINPIHKMGYQTFARMAKQTGIDGLIVPDLIPEESRSLEEALKAQKVDLIMFVSPTTPLARQKNIIRRAHGFVYAVSVTGVTGQRSRVSNQTVEFLKRLNKISTKPVAVGFGISKPEHVRQMAPYTDGVIIGSALVERLKKGVSLGPYISDMRKTLDSLAKKRNGI